MVVSQLPTPERPLAEVETNVVFSTGTATDNKWTLTIERDAATSNSVEVVFGCDANEDGVLGVEEGDLCVGWDCGSGAIDAQTRHVASRDLPSVSI